MKILSKKLEAVHRKALTIIHQNPKRILIKTTAFYLIIRFKAMIWKFQVLHFRSFYICSYKSRPMICVFDKSTQIISIWVKSSLILVKVMSPEQSLEPKNSWYLGFGLVLKKPKTQI
jgi:hypothetical protein